MFTGLVEILGCVVSKSAEGRGKRLRVEAPAFAASAALGESIAMNGACLTVVKHDTKILDFQVSPETLTKTNLGELKVGDAVNLERALRLGDPLGGHWVQGHVDGIGRIQRRHKEGEWEMVWFSAPPPLTEEMVSKGSITVDGVSLTIVEVTSDAFSVALIPHTLEQTTLGRKGVGSTVNLETDILAKYVRKCLRGSGVQWEQLRAAGFLQS